MSRFATQVSVLLCVWFLTPSTIWADWQQHTVRQLNGNAEQIELTGQRQIVTESWNAMVRCPYLVYMPEKDRLAMLVNQGDPLHAGIITSDDRGKTWSRIRWTRKNEKGEPNSGNKAGLTYLGDGKLLMAYGTRSRWTSTDYGQSWLQIEGIKEHYEVWDPIMVERDSKTGKVSRLVEPLYRPTGEVKWTQQRVDNDAAYSQAYVRFSLDEGKTWNPPKMVPQWRGLNEVSLARAKNGHIVAACRTGLPKRFRAYPRERTGSDHYTGLAVSVSKDNGQTWSDLNRLYDWGRHHPSMVLMPNGDIVMSYVVRCGYTDTTDGFTRFGIEAVVSHDNGQTWDLDHRYILDCWPAPIQGENSWAGGCQSTGSVLLPDGWILTTYGTGYRAKYNASGRPVKAVPRDIGLVRWRPNSGAVNSHRTIRDAAYDSDLRNVFDPTCD